MSTDNMIQTLWKYQNRNSRKMIIYIFVSQICKLLNIFVTTYIVTGNYVGEGSWSAGLELVKERVDKTKRRVTVGQPDIIPQCHHCCEHCNSSPGPSIFQFFTIDNHKHIGAVDRHIRVASSSHIEVTLGRVGCRVGFVKILIHRRDLPGCCRVAIIYFRESSSRGDETPCGRRAYGLTHTTTLYIQFTRGR